MNQSWISRQRTDGRTDTDGQTRLSAMVAVVCLSSVVISPGVFLGGTLK